MKKIVFIAIALIVATSVVFAQNHKHVVLTPGDTVVISGIPATTTMPIGKTYHPKRVKHGSGYLVRRDHPIAIPTTTAPAWFNAAPVDSNKYAVMYYQRLLADRDSDRNFTLWIALAGVIVTVCFALLFVYYVLHNRPYAVADHAPVAQHPSPIHQVFHNHGGAGGVAHGANASIRKTTELPPVAEKENEDQSPVPAQ